MAGRGTAAALARRAAPKDTSETTCQRRSMTGAATALRYARTDPRKKNPHRTSLRSVIHTTDSTRSGCTAKRRAEQVAPSDEGPRPGFGAPGAREGDQASRDQVEEHGVGAVQEHVQRVIAPRLEAAHHVVEAEAHPGQRNVVAEHGAGPHPYELLAPEPVHAGIVDHVVPIVPVQEVAAEARPEGDDGRDEHETAEADGDPPPARRRSPGSALADRADPLHEAPRRRGGIGGGAHAPR